MADGELRELGRELLADKGPLARIRYSHALARAGREEDALALLLEARDDPQVRAELGRLPAWTHPRGDAGRTRFADVAPALKTPGVRWTVDVEPAPSLLLLASPLGVVVATRTGLAILEPRDGSTRSVLPPAREVVIAGDALVTAGGTRLDVHELATGREVASIDVTREVLGLCYSDGVLLASLAHEVVAWSLGPLGETPRVLWQLSASAALPKGILGRVLASAGVAITSGERGFAVVDLRRGEVRARDEGSPEALDAHGVLVLGPGKTLLLAARERGRPTLELAKGAWSSSLAVAPGQVVYASGRRNRTAFHVADRATAASRALGLEVHGADPPVALARDVLYVAHEAGAVEAVRTSGEKLWKLERWPAQAHRLAPIGRGLIALGYGWASCVEEGH